MATAVNLQLALTDAERDLLLELLKRERTDLPSEIHHTRTSAVRDELRRRLEMVESLIRRLETTAVPA